ncbi:linear amide C-N hydrolase, partial [Francisella tularensis]|uniref:linear amide C-N hydrolase n=1 Tax=Francisella tularensis TaxID=263 RepID=UPI002381C101
TFACSEFNHNFDGDLVVYTNITMDFFIDIKPNLNIYPRCTQETGGLKNNSLTWTDKYGYVSIDETNLANFIGEGLNEKGLVAHLLYLWDTIQPKRDTSKPDDNGLDWRRFV